MIRQIVKPIILLLLTGAPLFAQKVDYNKIILPDNATSDDFAEKLVRLAWQNYPLNDVYRREATMARQMIKISKAQWLDIINIQGNLNEFVLDPGTDVLGRSAFYPKYNIRADISLGMLFKIPADVRKSREYFHVAQANVNAQKLAVRNAVLKAYNEYLLREQVFKLQAQVLVDAENTHKVMEERFRNGEVTFEEYSQSLQALNETKIAYLDAENLFKNARLDIEQWIGIPLEEVR